MPPHRILKTIDLLQQRRDTEEEAMVELWCEFGQSIRCHRKKLKIGLRQFAASLAVSRSMIGFLESGKRQWNFEMARKAVKLLNK